MENNQDFWERFDNLLKTKFPYTPPLNDDMKTQEGLLNFFANLLDEKKQIAREGELLNEKYRLQQQAILKALYYIEQTLQSIELTSLSHAEKRGINQSLLSSVMQFSLKFKSDNDTF
jgi:hypothetical protein